MQSLHVSGGELVIKALRRYSTHCLQEGIVVRERGNVQPENQQGHHDPRGPRQDQPASSQVGPGPAWRGPIRGCLYV